MLRWLLRRIAAPAHRAADAIPGVRRREDVLSLGQTSKGVTQVRGNDTTRSHLGKTMGRDLLRVCWRGPSGGEDAIAWLLDDLGGWHATLRSDPSG